MCCCLALVCCSSGALAAEDGSDDVSREIESIAEDEKVSFDGVRGLLGISYPVSTYGASVGSSDRFTSNKFGLPGMTVGVEYGLPFNNGLSLAVGVGLKVSKGGNKRGSWEELNRELEKQRGPAYAGERTGDLKANGTAPNVSLKLGYLVKACGGQLYVIFGAAQEKGKYEYCLNGNSSVAGVEISAYKPFFGVGGERKIKHSLSASLEGLFTMGNKVKNNFDTIVTHTAKVRRVEIRIMLVHSISKLD